MGAYEAPEFGSLPEQEKGSGKGSHVSLKQAAALRSQPGAWAKIGDYKGHQSASGRASTINRGRVRAFLPTGDYEAVARGQEVWARYIVGAPADAPTEPTAVPAEA